MTNLTKDYALPSQYKNVYQLYFFMIPWIAQKPFWSIDQPLLIFNWYVVLDLQASPVMLTLELPKLSNHNFICTVLSPLLQSIGKITNGLWHHFSVDHDM